MSRRVFLHIGLPKTGTSYLQSIWWRERDGLRAAGLLVPGRERRDHLLSSMVVREDPAVARRGPGAHRAWDVVRAEVAAHPGDALVSHEFFCSATAEQARRAVSDLAPAEVHVVVTAREPLGLFASSWQESLKNKETAPLEAYSTEVSDDPTVIWNWRALDLGLVLRRWGPAVPDEHVHVITPPSPGQSREALWDRVCGVLGLPPDVVPHESGFANASMGVVEAELLRRLNPRLHDVRTARERARWIRTLLADRMLVRPGAERFVPDERQVSDARRRGEEAVAWVRAHRYDVRGDLDALLVPDPPPRGRHPSEVSDAELLEAALQLDARLLAEVRHLHERLDERDGPSPGAAGPRWRRAAGAARRRLAGRLHSARSTDA